MLNDCAYCVEHHFQGLNRLLADPARAAAIRAALEDDQPAAAFDAGPAAALAYAGKLTRTPAAMVEAMSRTCAMATTMARSSRSTR